jgi:FixJ family two-component response regulator
MNMKVDRPIPSRRRLLPPGRGDEPEQPLVIIVDDDASIREALSELTLSAGFRPVCFASIQELLDADVLDSPGCLILDVRMPGASGLDLQKHLAQSGIRKPIIFLTGHGDIPMTVQAMKAGAVDFLTKPVRDQALLDAVNSGIAMDAVLRSDALLVSRNVERFRTLTSREREVLREVARGRLNKQIAFDLGISDVTVKLHRSNVMRKMGTRSLGELIRAWETLPLPVRSAGVAEGTYEQSAAQRLRSAQPEPDVRYLARVVRPGRHPTRSSMESTSALRGRGCKEAAGYPEGDGPAITG